MSVRVPNSNDFIPLKLPRELGPVKEYQCRFFIECSSKYRLIFSVYDKNRELMGKHRGARLDKPTEVKLHLKTDGAHIDVIIVSLKSERVKEKIIAWKAPFAGCQFYQSRLCKVQNKGKCKEPYELSLEDRPILNSKN